MAERRQLRIFHGADFAIPLYQCTGFHQSHPTPMTKNEFDPLPPPIPFQEVIDALLDAETPLPPRYLYRFSDLEADEIENLKAVWDQIPTWRRKALLEDLEQLFGDDYLLSFEAICRIGLEDQESEIRFLSLRSLFEYEVEDLIPVFLNQLTKDSDTDVRAAAASALGKYVYLGEIEELDPEILRKIEDQLFVVLQGTDETLVRRRALEALGFSSRKELPVLIEKAFTTQENEWTVSALFAMGRSCDKRWQEQVMTSLDHVLPAIRLEAARAAGEIEISDATERLIDLLEDDSEDVRMASAWSLSQIGGEDAQEALYIMLDATENIEEAEFIESAIDNLIFNQSVQFYGIMDFPRDGNEIDDSFEDDFDFDDYTNEDYDN
jgi:HEAT repeat protein